jgi:beta-glucanase (GH16 family)
MSFRQKLKGLQDRFDHVMDAVEEAIDGKKTQPQNPPAVPSRPGQPSPWVPQHSKPESSSDAPPPYVSSNQSGSSYYWNPDFAPEIPVAHYFDFDLGAGGWGNNELQTYTSYSTNSFHTPDKKLVVRAVIDSTQSADRDKFTSARLLSKQRLGQQSGYVSAVLAAPCAAGIWPAFWMLPQEPFSWPVDGEVDIFESWNGDLKNHSCLHWGHYTTPEELQKHRVTSTHIPDMNQPHEYGVAWTQPEWGQEGGQLVFYVDGRTVMKATKPPGTRRFEDWRILLNIAVGGNVCGGQRPADGSYDLVLTRVSMSSQPPGGWEQFEQDWKSAPLGRPI